MTEEKNEPMVDDNKPEVAKQDCLTRDEVMVDHGKPHPEEELTGVAVQDKVQNHHFSKDEDNNLRVSGKAEESAISRILDHIQKCPAIFRSQQIGDPDLSESDKRQIASDLLHESRIRFLVKFGEYLEEEHLKYFSSSDNSYEMDYHVKQLKSSLNKNKHKIIKRNRRFEALKRMEAEGFYFSESEMEKREPLLYHQLVGQYLSEKEKLQRSIESNEKVIPTFSSFLISKMEKDEVDELRKSQQEEEENMDGGELWSEDENSKHSIEDEQDDVPVKRWGDDWLDEEAAAAAAAATSAKKNKNKKQKKVHLSSKEKKLLLDEFRSIMHNKFINGMDREFDYSKVDTNPEYDCLQLRSQDEEEKYFDEETCDNELCTDTGIEDY